MWFCFLCFFKMPFICEKQWYSIKWTVTEIHYPGDTHTYIQHLVLVGFMSLCVIRLGNIFAKLCQWKESIGNIDTILLMLMFCMFWSFQERQIIPMGKTNFKVSYINFCSTVWLKHNTEYFLNSSQKHQIT